MPAIRVRAKGKSKKVKVKRQKFGGNRFLTKAGFPCLFTFTFLLLPSKRPAL
jgi:hypothetical protein